MMEFNGLDLLVEKPIDEAALCRAIAATLGVPEGRVTVIDDISNYPASEDADVVCVVSSVEGEFSLLVSIQVNKLALPYENTVALTQCLAEQLSAACLIPDEDDVDPYNMWLVLPGSEPRRVGVDPVALDQDRYVISRR